MRASTNSFERVPYDIRPAKQVERRMMLDAFRILSIAGLPISEYRYVGFGAIHFVDFIMVHKLLGIRKLTSVEKSEEIRKRLEFNRPYSCIEVVIRPASEVIPELSNDEKHVLWLDYDDVLNEELLSDVWTAASHLCVGSILIVTVDAEPPTDLKGRKQMKEHFESVAGTYLGDRPSGQYARERLASVNVDVLSRALQSGVTGRPGVDIIPIFSFLYKDGHEMLTLGCVIGTDHEQRQLAASRLSEQVYYRNSFDIDPYRIRVPVITKKERAHLDGFMPCAADWLPEPFELDAADVRAYMEVYRFLPAYAELLL